ncbi:15258_t:CDS:2 [Cetraspora pellucida]|uniref:15258_t:CDS:1 n=1 Tax=Cetraspora pellucida TaxID=1433469 RepID=A0A9N9NDN9_9GLOM|nr:15258_t:CDS:2 [Cetraspora pellucida]
MSQPSEYNESYDDNSFTSTNSKPDKLAITILTQNCKPDNMLYDDIKIVDLDNLNTIFENENLVVDYDKIFKTETTIKEYKIKVNDFINCDELVEKIKCSLHRALNFY